MAFQYGQPLAGMSSVKAFAEQVRKEELDKANKIRADRKAFHDKINNSNPFASGNTVAVKPTSSSPKAPRPKGASSKEKELWSKVEATKEWKQYHSAAEARRKAR